MKNIYQAHIAGFTSKNLTMPEVQQWWDGLKAQYGVSSFAGQTLRIWKATWANNEAACFSAKPSFEKVVS
jgi:hypothetical protein